MVLSFSVIRILNVKACNKNYKHHQNLKRHACYKPWCRQCCFLITRALWTLSFLNKVEQWITVIT